MQSNLMRAAPLELHLQTFNQRPRGFMLSRKTFAKQGQDKSAEIGVKNNFAYRNQFLKTYIFKILGANFRIVTQNEVYFYFLAQRPRGNQDRKFPLFSVMEWNK